jgi:NACHT domain
MNLDEFSAWLNVPAALAVAPPVQSRIQELPLEQLHWDDFERLCCRLVRFETDIEHWQRYGVRGQDQEGIDVFGRRRGGESYALYQCKRVQSFGPAAMHEAVGKFLEGSWSSRAASFVLCMSESGVPAKHAEAIEEQARRLAERKIVFEVWDRERISELLKAHPELVDDFFGREWVKAFCGVEAADALGTRLDSFSVQEFRRDLGEFYRYLFDSHDPGIPIPRREGARAFPLDERYVLPDVYVRDVGGVVNEGLAQINSSSESDTSQRSSLAEGEAAEGSERKRSEFRRERKRAEAYASRERVDTWLTRSKRSVVVGGPGSGKSSLLRYIVLDILSDSPALTKLAAKFGGLLPVWVPFAFWTKLVSAGERESSLSQCIERWLEEWNKARLWPLVQRAMEDKRLFLLIDGLDEWTDEDSGRLACQRLQVLLDQNDLSAIVVTRPYGYVRMPRFGNGWQAADLAQLSDQQRTEVCQKWFRLKHLAGSRANSENLPDLVMHDAAQFLTELSRSSDLSDLSRVPFLLLLLLYLGLERAVLPTRRFRAFELMIDQLIAEHPANRRLAASLGGAPRGLVESDLRRVLARIAFVVQETRPDGLIAEEELEEVVRAFLVDDVMGLRMEPSEARPLLHQFTSIAEGSLGILVHQATRRLSFFHRSFQEYLAGVHISRLDLDDQKSLVEGRFDDPRWKDVLLSVFYMTGRPEELRSLLQAMSATSATKEFARAELCAEVAFGDFDCPADLAKKIADESFLAIEHEAWMSHRERLLEAALQGIHSGRTAEMVRRRLRRWVYSRTGWQAGWFDAMRHWPAEAATLSVLLSGIYDEEPSTQRAASRALAAVFGGDQRVGDTLSQLALRSPLPKLRAAAMEALGLGWAEHESMEAILSQSERSLSAEVRLAAIGVRISRGVHGGSDFNLLLELARSGSDLRVHYAWSQEITNGLVIGWRGSETLKKACLDALERNYDLRYETMSPGAAIPVLLRGFPHDSEVAKQCAREITHEQYPFIGMSQRGDAWTLLRENFQDDPTIVEAIDSWFDKNKVDTMEVAHAALVGCTPKGKAVLLETLSAHASFPHWSAWGLLEGWGMKDAKVSETLLQIANGPAGPASQIAHLIPRVITDGSSARARLLEILNDPGCVRHDFVIEGFACLSDKGDVVELASACLKALPRTQGLHRQSMEHHIIASFPDVQEVRDLALERLASRNPPISAVAFAFAGDPQVRARVAELVQALPVALRARIVSKIASQPPEDEFALSILKDYDVEEDDELKTVASIAYHRSLRRNGRAETAIEELISGVSCYGPDYEERRRAAFAGLLVLERVELTRDRREQSEKAEPLSIDLGRFNEPNLPLVRLVAEKWSYLKSVLGDSLPNRISRWHHDCWSPLCRVAADYPDLQSEILSILEADPKLAANPHALAFVARARPASQLVIDRCLAAMPAPDTNFPRASFVAAEILAGAFAGDEYVYSKLLEKLPIARGGPWLYVRPELAIALCIGWPNSEVIEDLYRQAVQDARSTSDYSAFFEITMSRCPAEDLPSRLSQYLAAAPVVTNHCVSAGLVRALVRRLRHDPVAARGLLTALTASTRRNDKASFARSLATANGLSAELRDYCLSEIGNQIGLDSPEIGFDLISGELRGVYLSLLDSLGGLATGVRLEGDS